MARERDACIQRRDGMLQAVEKFTIDDLPVSAKATPRQAICRVRAPCCAAIGQPRTRLPRVSARQANGVAVIPRISATNCPRSANFITHHERHRATLYTLQIKYSPSLYFSAPLPGKKPNFSQIWRILRAYHVCTAGQKSAMRPPRVCTHAAPCTTDTSRHTNTTLNTR